MHTDVTKVLVVEHVLILRMVSLVEEEAARLAAGGAVDGGFWRDAVAFIRGYADRFHHAKEEEVLFTALVKNGMPEKRSPIEAMHLEHERGRAHVRALEAAAEAALAGVPGQEPLIVAHACGYAELLRGHIEREDTILYPLAERVLPEEVRPAMLRDYAAAAARTPGLEERCRELVAGYERRTAA